MEQVRCRIQNAEKQHDDLILPDGVSISLGRSPDTKIKDTKCSRKQVELTANYEDRQITIKQYGPNTGFVNGKELAQHDTAILQDGESFSLIGKQYSYTVIFEGGDESKPASSSKPGKRKVNDSSATSPTKKPKVENDEEDRVNDIKKKLEEMRKLKGKNLRSPQQSAAAPVKMDTSTNEPVSTSKWRVNDKFLVYNPQGLVHRDKVISFDIDGTIICTKSGKVFPVNYHDWRILFPEIPGKLKELHNSGYKLVFMTNQKGISTGKTGVKEFQGKVEAILKRFEVPVQVFVSTGIGEYRKPTPGMWTLLETEENGGIPIDRSNSIYVGDAAGRAAGWAHGKKKDFSNNDRLFALNLGIEFFTPEEYFLKQKKVPFGMPSFDPRTVALVDPSSLCDPPDATITKDGCELIVFVGFPASGKSHFAKENLASKGYVHVNRDTLGTWQKCVAACDKALAAGKSVVVDNTNPDVDSRSKYLQCAKKYKIPSRCFVFNVGLEQAKHNNRFRELSGTDKAHKGVNDMVLNSYKSKFKEPTTAEGFEEIVKINFVPDFKSKESQELYSLFLLEK